MILGTLLFSALIISPAYGITGKVIKTLGEDELQNKVIKSGDQLETNEGEVLIEIHPSLQVILFPQSKIKLASDEIILQQGSILYYGGDTKTSPTVSLKMIKFSPKSTHVEFQVTKMKDEVLLNVKTGEVEAASPLVMTFVPEIIKGKKGFAFSADRRKFEQRAFKLQGESKLDFKRKQD